MKNCRCALREIGGFEGGPYWTSSGAVPVAWPLAMLVETLVARGDLAGAEAVLDACLPAAAPAQRATPGLRAVNTRCQMSWPISRPKV